MTSRELLLSFLKHLLDAGVYGAGFLADHPEEVVDEYLRSEAPGFAGFTDDELKGVARDGEAGT